MYWQDASRKKTQHLISNFEYTTYDIYDGPKWYFSLHNFTWFGEPGNSIMGMPYMDGTSIYMMSVSYPISSVENSECKYGSFGFALYYSSQEELLISSDSASDLGTSCTTYAPFSTFKEVLRKDIYETD